MKILFDDDHIKIYISKQYKNIRQDNIEEELKQFFINLNAYYKLELSGFYLVTVYIDKIYGVIIDMNKTDIDYFDYYDDQVDMKITFKETEFLYQIDDNLYFENIDYLDIIFLQGKMYGKINQNIDNIRLGKIIEMTNEIRV